MEYVSLHEDITQRFLETTDSFKSKVDEIKDDVSPFILKELNSYVVLFEQLGLSMMEILEEITKPSDQMIERIQNFILKNDIKGLKKYYDDQLISINTRHEKSINGLRSENEILHNKLIDNVENLKAIKCELKKSKMQNEKADELIMSLCDKCKGRLIDLY